MLLLAVPPPSAPPVPVLSRVCVCCSDCCSAESSFAFCELCLCLDCTVSRSDACTVDIKGYCGTAYYAADGYCDADNNNAGCDWDGGDCCGPGARMTFCTTGGALCGCRNCAYVSPCSGDVACSKPGWQGDGFCDDVNNVCGCAWDGGDCCDADSKFDYCSSCECLDPDQQPDGDCTGSCWNYFYAGDGFCDDDNNKCACGWDGGGTFVLSARATPVPLAANAGEE